MQMSVAFDVGQRSTKIVSKEPPLFARSLTTCGRCGHRPEEFEHYHQLQTPPNKSSTASSLSGHTQAFAKVFSQLGLQVENK